MQNGPYQNNVYYNTGFKWFMHYCVYQFNVEAGEDVANCNYFINFIYYVLCEFSAGNQ